MTVLSAPSSPHELRVLNAVILVVSIASACGAGFIALSFISFKSLRSFRHQLILYVWIIICLEFVTSSVSSTYSRFWKIRVLWAYGHEDFHGLAISDFWMAINFLSSAAMNLSGKPIGTPKQEQFCSFNGFMIQVFVVQTDYWVFAIAVCTYLILADHKKWSNWIQDRKYIVWILPWLFSLLWALLGLTLVGYGDIGAWCWFTSDRVRLLVNFIPRWVIIITILALYIRLYFILHNAHNSFRAFNDVELTSENNNQDTSSTPQSTSRPKRTVFKFSSSTNDEEVEAGRSGRARLGRSTTMLKRVSYQMMAYPLVYLLIWTIPTTIRIYQSTTNKAAPFAIGTVDKACIVIQGLADALVYGFNEHTWGVWRGVFRNSGQKSLILGIEL